MAFDLVIVDEAAQALEAACWIPILQARTKVVLAGDHCQLPPTIQSNNPLVMKGLGETMFERVMKLYGDDTQEYNQSTRGESVGRVSRMLNVQYRMHENIANWASQALYGGKLQSHDSVKHRTLASLTDIHTDKSLVSIKDVPLLLIDTAGCAMYESENAAGSRFNEGEAELVIEHVRKLINMGIQQDQIAVITPYNGQVEVLKLALLPEAPKLQIRSVDGFQGGEREAVVLSLVRSSERGGIGGIGFLRDDRRLNVAVTRAKRHCCLICDTETVSQSPFVKNLIEWIEEHGEQRSALEMRNMVLNRDLLQAELEVQIMESLALEKNRAMQNAKHPIDPVDADRRRGALYEVIQNFIATGQPGDEMALSSELTKLDRKIIHEIAEEFNLEHRSEGIEGKDRRIILGVQKPCALPGNEGISITPATLAEHQEPQRGTPTSKDDSDLEVDLLTTDFNSQQQFHALTALQLEDDNSEARESSVSPTPELQQDTNLLLAGLARERAQRDRTRQQQQVVEAVQKKVRKQKKGQKLGGTKKITEKRTEPECFADFNDMAYLDAHIEQVQTSHGRKVEGSGSNYRTIINGVLLGKPKQDVKQKNSQVSATLQAKLKQAQDGRRKAKTKKR
jgi:ATP-dependent RNA/DNA helicase IGHMBP2